MQNQIEFYEKKLAYEMDSSELYDSFKINTDYTSDITAMWLYNC